MRRGREVVRKTVLGEVIHHHMEVYISNCKTRMKRGEETSTSCLVTNTFYNKGVSKYFCVVVFIGS